MTSTPWFWMWLGGVVGYAMVALDNPDMRQTYARSRYHHGRGVAVASYVTAMIVAMLWPIGVVTRLLFGRWIYSLMSRDRVTVDARCSVCGFAGEIEAPKGGTNWASLPNGWFVNQQLEITCSLKCALHHDRCPAHTESSLH